MATADVCCCHQIKSAALYKGKANCGGLKVSAERQLRAFAEESRRLKKLLAEAMLCNVVSGSGVGEMRRWSRREMRNPPRRANDVPLCVRSRQPAAEPEEFD